MDKTDMPKKKYVFHKRLVMSIVALISFLMPVSAQGAAEVWLDKAAQVLQNKGAEIVFRVNEDGMRFSGKVLMEGSKFLYDTEAVKIWYDGTTQWTLQMGNEYNELYINNPTVEEQQIINPYLLLNDYKETFDVTGGGMKNHNGKLTHQVILTARDISQEPSSINVYINNDATLSALEFIAADGNVYKIEVRSFRNGLTFPKDTFTYEEEKFSIDEVIDMR